MISVFGDSLCLLHQIFLLEYIAAYFYLFNYFDDLYLRRFPLLAPPNFSSRIYRGVFLFISLFRRWSLSLAIRFPLLAPPNFCPRIYRSVFLFIWKFNYFNDDLCLQRFVFLCLLNQIFLPEYIAAYFYLFNYFDDDLCLQRFPLLAPPNFSPRIYRGVFLFI